MWSYQPYATRTRFSLEMITMKVEKPGLNGGGLAAGLVSPEKTLAETHLHPDTGMFFPKV
jgi:hypothetical protein